MKRITRFIYVAVAVVIITIGAVATSADPINPGDVFVSFEKQGMNFVRHYDSNMNLLETLNTGYNSFAAGMAFDGNGDLFVTNFNATFISRFSHVDGSALPPWSTGRLGHEDILFDGNCNAWVSNTGAGGGLDKFSSSGVYLNTYIPGQRTDWIDLASDQKTMFYTHEGQGSDAVLRADVSSFPGTLLTDFVTLPSGPGRIGYAVKFLPDGGILVADRVDILRYTSTGQFVQSYDATGHNDFFGMSVGTGGTSVWAVDLVQQDIVNIDLVTGVATITPMNDNTVFMGSVIVAGGYRAAACTPTPTATPPPCLNYCKYAIFGLDSVTLSNMAGGGAPNKCGVNGDVGIGGGTGTLEKTTVCGKVFVDSSAKPRIHSDFHATMGIFFNQNLSQDKADALALSATLAGLPCTQTFGDITGNTTITSTGPLNVICVNSINLVKSTLTLIGNSCDIFVINVTSPTADFILNNSQIILSGGLTSDQVIFNFPGTGGSVRVFKQPSVMNGTILAPQRDIVIDNPPVNGSVIGSTVNIHSGAKVTGCHCPPPCP